MILEWMQALASVGGLLVALIGVPLVYLQLRGVQRSLHGATHVAIYQQAADFRSHLVSHPELRRFFFGGAEISPEHADYDRVVTLAELMLNYLEHIAVLGESLGRSNRPALDRFTEHAFQRAPILKRHLEVNRAAYSPALHAASSSVRQKPFAPSAS